MPRPITPEQACAAWAILVRLAGARDDPPGWNRESFVYHVASPHPVSVYRFGGALGFGCKFRNSGDIPYVDCHPEHLTPEWERIIAETNAALRELFAERVAA
jgi:hypothetical protein